MQLMSEHQFEIQMDRIRAVFGDKNYDAIRITMIWGCAKFYPYETFCKVVDHLIASFRIAPLPKDFKEALNAEKKSLPYQPETFAHIISCDYCLDTGVCCVTQGRVRFLARCDCKLGLKSCWGLPIYTVLNERGWVKNQLEFYFGPDILGTKKISDKTKEWRSTIQLSEMFWRIELQREQKNQ